MIYDITPVPKPRMTQRDKRGDKRPIVARYHAFKDECRLKSVRVPEFGAVVLFTVPVPKSWSNLKKKYAIGNPHQQTPDIDNYLKALLDACYEQDCRVWDIHVTKIWGVKGQIEIE